MELMPADGKCIVARDGTIVWCDAAFRGWFAHRGLAVGARIGQLFPGAKAACDPGAVYEDRDPLGKRRFFTMDCRPSPGPDGERAGDEVRIRKVTLQKVLEDIPKIASRAAGPDELLEQALRLLRDTTHYLAFAGYIARDGRVELAASKGWTERLKAYISVQPIAPDSPSLAGRTAYHRRQAVMAMRDYGLMPEVKAAIQKLGGEYLVVTPLADRDRLVGVLTVIDDHVLAPADSRALEAVCGQLAVALDLKLREEAAAAKADDAVLFANLLARLPRGGADGEDREALLRALNDGELPGSVPLAAALDFAVAGAERAGDAPRKKLGVRASGLEGVEAGFLVKYALLEALKNSLDHSTAQVAEVEVRLGRDRSGGVRIDVSDRGPGIPDEFKSEVFRPVKASLRAGMGLHLVKRIANRYGGRVWIEDRVHGDRRKGASLVITLPRESVTFTA